ncbi:MAG: hypothetical protein WCK58_14275 [Chloroflexota bacterium]
MVSPRYSVLRDLAALVVIILACPAALFGGSMLGCVGQGFNAGCAMTAMFVSPILLLTAGLVAGLITRGWTGLMLVLIGTLLGMSAILLLSFGVGQPVPLDPISGVIATVWFSGPIAIGYGIGRLIIHIVRRGEDEDEDEDEGAAAASA